MKKLICLVLSVYLLVFPAILNKSLAMQIITKGECTDCSVDVVGDELTVSVICDSTSDGICFTVNTGSGATDFSNCPCDDNGINFPGNTNKPFLSGKAFSKGKISQFSAKHIEVIEIADGIMSCTLYSK